jgi:hypothetical protein
MHHFCDIIISVSNPVVVLQSCIYHSSGVLDVSELVGQKPGRVLLVNSMACPQNSMSVLVSPLATVIDPTSPGQPSSRPLTRASPSVSDNASEYSSERPSSNPGENASEHLSSDLSQYLSEQPSSNPRDNSSASRLPKENFSQDPTKQLSMSMPMPMLMSMSMSTSTSTSTSSNPVPKIHPTSRKHNRSLVVRTFSHSASSEISTSSGVTTINERGAAISFYVCAACFLWMVCVR